MERKKAAQIVADSETYRETVELKWITFYNVRLPSYTSAYYITFSVFYRSILNGTMNSTLKTIFSLFTYCQSLLVCLW